MEKIKKYSTQQVHAIRWVYSNIIYSCCVKRYLKLNIQNEYMHLVTRYDSLVEILGPGVAIGAVILIW